MKYSIVAKGQQTYNLNQGQALRIVRVLKLQGIDFILLKQK